MLQGIYAFLRSPKGWWAIWFLSAISILLNSWFDPYGGITLDGPWYLKLGQSLAGGQGMNVLSPDYIFYANPHYCHLWPPLYPLFIAGMSIGNLIPVWWSFRLVNWILLGLTLKCLWRFQTPNRLAFAAMLFSGYWIDMQYQCWSEWPAICLVIIFFIWHKQQPDSTGMHLILMTLLWLTRYQLAMLPFLYALEGIYLRKNKQWIYGFINAFAAILFIYLNFMLPNRIWLDNGIATKEILATAFFQLLNQLNFLFCHHLNSFKLLCCSLLVLFFIIRNQTLLLKSFLNLPVFVGLTYLSVALLMRSGFAVGIAHDRFYTFFLTCILTGLFLALPFQPRPWLTLLILASFIINAGVKNVYINMVQKQEVFTERFNTMQRRYQHIPRGSILVFGDKWSEFIRPDIYSISPYENVMGSLSWKPEPFFKLMQKQGRPVYIEFLSPEDPKLKRYHPEFREWMKTHQAQNRLYLP